MNAFVQPVLAQLERAWNDGDGERYAWPFTADAEQVNIFGTRLSGRAEIAQRHDRIFKTIFAGSINVFELLGARELAPGVLLAQAVSTVSVPSGPLQGELRTIASLVLRRTDSQWQIVLFHNTRITPQE